tara:strand:- start:29 stop:631 length:603 start_codon:yes stop_codon:yes gene_type:complete
MNRQIVVYTKFGAKSSISKKKRSINWKLTIEHVLVSLESGVWKAHMSPGSITLMNRIINNFGKQIVNKSLLSTRKNITITIDTIVSAVKIVMEDQHVLRKQALKNIERGPTNKNKLSDVTIPTVIKLLKECSNGEFFSTEKALIALAVLFEYFVAEILMLAKFDEIDTRKDNILDGKILPKHIKKSIDYDEELKMLTINS